MDISGGLGPGESLRDRLGRMSMGGGGPLGGGGPMGGGGPDRRQAGSPDTDFLNHCYDADYMRNYLGRR